MYGQQVYCIINKYLYMELLCFNIETECFRFRPHLCTLFRLNWTNQAITGDKEVKLMMKHLSGFDPATQCAEVHHATSAQLRLPVYIYGDKLYNFELNYFNL